MRVLHVMEATIGGTRRHLVDVARGQNERGLDVHLAVATARDPDFPADLAALEAEGVGVTRLPMVREIAPGADWRDMRSLMALLRELNPDIVHTHSSKAGVLGRLASLRSGIGRRVHTPHTFAFLFGALFGPAKRKLIRRIESWLANRTDRIVAVSESEAATFRTSGVVPEQALRVIPNGIDPRRFEGAQPFDLAGLGLDPQRPTGAVIGLVYAAKGQDLALECLAQPGCGELQLLIVGPGSDEEMGALEARVEALSVSERVRILGPRRDVPEILAALDFLVLPSRWEGMPYIVLEAMASGRAVVATPVDGARETIEDGVTGLLASEVGELASLAAAVARMCALSPSERDVMGRAGRERVVATYSVDAMVDSLCELYREVSAQ